MIGIIDITNLMSPLLWLEIHLRKYIFRRIRGKPYSAYSRAAITQSDLLSLSPLANIWTIKPGVTVATCWEEFEYLGFPLSDEWKSNQELPQFLTSKWLQGWPCTKPKVFKFQF